MDRSAFVPADHPDDGRINTAVAALDEREAEILRLHLGLDRGAPRTYAEIGEAFKLTAERIEQIVRRAFAKLPDDVAATPRAIAVG